MFVTPETLTLRVHHVTWWCDVIKSIVTFTSIKSIVDIIDHKLFLVFHLFDDALALLEMHLLLV